MSKFLDSLPYVILMVLILEALRPVLYYLWYTLIVFGRWGKKRKQVRASILKCLSTGRPYSL